MTRAEKILNKYIKGDIERDYDKASRKEHTVTLETALKAIEQALKISPNLPVSGRSEQLKMFENMQYYMEHCIREGYCTPQQWIEKHKHF